MKAITVVAVAVALMIGLVFGGTSDICNLPMKTDCRGYFPRYYYDSVNKKCTYFIYGGCNGNANRFKTLQQCKTACVDVCNLPKDSGPCLAYFRKYYYDNVSKTCKSFVYGGCQGNDNRFATIKDCKKTCDVFSGCYYNGVYKPPGSSWKVSCNTCGCNGGLVPVCTHMDCV